MHDDGSWHVFGSAGLDDSIPSYVVTGPADTLQFALFFGSLSSHAPCDPMSSSGGAAVAAIGSSRGWLLYVCMYGVKSK